MAASIVVLAECMGITTIEAEEAAAANNSHVYI